MSVDEQRLVEEAKNGDRKAFDTLTELHLEKAYSIAFGYTGNESDARDIVQEAFYKVYVNLRRYDPKYPFAPWFYRIVVNSCINFSKRRRRKRSLFLEKNPKSDVNLVDMTAESENNPEKNYIRGEMQQLLHNGLQKLPEKQRSAIILFDLEGFSQQQVAAILKCPQGSVMSRIFYGRRKLRNLIEKYI